MFPIRDENPLVRKPIANISIIGLNIAAWIFLQGMGDPASLAKSFCLYALIPGDLLGLAPPDGVVSLGSGIGCKLGVNTNLITPISSMFLHGGWFHLIGNMWFLWIFGDNVEDAMGIFRFTIFYLFCGLAAAAAQIMTNPASVVPMVGASGAIGGVMGAYARLYPRAHVHTLIVLGFFFTTVSLPAFAMLGYWFVIQLLGGLPVLGGAEGGVAFWAHVGGFIAGIILVGPLHRRDFVAAHRHRPPRRTSRHRLF